MIYKLTSKNMKSNIMDYSSYLISLILSIALFYIFIALPESSVIYRLPKDIKAEMVQAFSYMNLLVLMSISLLVFYTNRYLIKRRYNEFYIYFTLGMSTRKISILSLVQSLFICVITLFFGLFFGILFSQGLQFFLAKIFDIDHSLVVFYISFKSIIYTILVFITLFLGLGIISSFKIYSSNPLKLFTTSKEKNIIENSVPVRNIIILCMSFIALVTCILITVCTKFDPRKIYFIGSLAPIYILTTYLIYYSFPDVLYFIINKYLKIYYSQVNMFSIKQTLTKAKNNWGIFGTLSLMLFFSSVCLSTGLILSSSQEEFKKINTPNDLEFSSNLGIDTNILNEMLISNGFVDAKLLEIPSYTIDSDFLSILDINKMNSKSRIKSSRLKIIAISLSDYNSLLRLNNYTEITFLENEFIYCENEDLWKGDFDGLIKENPQISINNSILKLNRNMMERVTVSSIWRFDTQGFAVIPDDKISFETIIDYNYFISLKKPYSREFLSKLQENIIKIDNNTGSSFSSKIYDTDMAKYSMIISIVLGVYLGFSFMLICITLLTFQISMDATNTKSNYEILLQIGTEKNIVKKSIFYQVVSYFIMPIILAFINFVPATIYIYRFITHIFANTITYNYFIAFIMYSLCYVSYMLFSYYSYKKIISI